MTLVEAHHELRVHPAARRWPMAVPLVPPLLLLLLLLLWLLQLRALQCNSCHFQFIWLAKLLATHLYT